MEIIERLESEVRSYCRAFPVVFERAEGPFLYDAAGRRYIDFFCGAGTLSYGHNHPELKSALVDYLAGNGIVHGLDMATVAKERFMVAFERVILRPRGLNYRLQFTGPTGANAVEAALKLARRVKNRRNLIAFTNGYHGLSSGALAVTANRFYRNESYVNRSDVAFMPFEDFMDEGVDSIHFLERMIAGNGSGVDLPAAVIVETVQAEGGVNVASAMWLRRLAALCKELHILLIVDDIQVGCGRTGSFFSFDRAGIRPDIVVLSKAISGFGLPMSLILIGPELDQWAPGEHSGTFRGNNLAFVTAAETLRFWETGELESSIKERSRQLADALGALVSRYPQLNAKVRGLGMIYGMEIEPAEEAQAVARAAFARGLVLELCGSRQNVLKFLPPLLIDAEVLHGGLVILEQAIEHIARQMQPDVSPVGTRWEATYECDMGIGAGEATE
jgi:diaminobutyrate-2-oxoglutarate transaminase